MGSFKHMMIFIAAMGMIAVFFAGTGNAENKAWTYDGVEYRLPQPVQEVQLPADVPESHTVVAGDCLWAISKTYLNDPFLWPLVWEENLDTVSNPHLIYPGDIIKLPGGTLLATEEMPPAEQAPVPPMKAFEEETGEQEGDSVVPVGPAKAPKEPKPFSVTTETDIMSSGFIADEEIDAPTIVSAETDSFDLVYNDVIFIEGGPKDGFEPDKTFLILRKKHDVKHPISGRNLGIMYHVMGEAKIVCVNDSITSARITKSYHAALRGDSIVPREEIPIPLTFGSPPIDPCNPSSKKLPGTIVDAFNGSPSFTDAVILAEGDVVYVDLGSRDGVAPGDYFTIFKHDSIDPRLPRYVSGELMIIKVQEQTSVAVITESRTAVFLGDQIELR